MIRIVDIVRSDCDVDVTYVYDDMIDVAFDFDLSLLILCCCIQPRRLGCAFWLCSSIVVVDLLWTFLICWFLGLCTCSIYCGRHLSCWVAVGIVLFLFHVFCFSHFIKEVLCTLLCSPLEIDRRLVVVSSFLQLLLMS